MKIPIPENLTNLAAECSFPLYLVGGSVRDCLAGFPAGNNPDWDICAPAPEEALIAAAEKLGFTVKSVYRHTGTVKLCDQKGVGYEFTRFRSDKYVRGLHTPAEIEFTTDLGTDARRRDFCANAVYYDIKTETLCDPLDGKRDIERKILRTVAPAEKVFGEDGLRLMRLARFAAETGFLPDAECAAGAKRNRALVKDIFPERVFAELNALLLADRKHGDTEAPYRGLCVLRDTEVLGEILPELASGNGMKQRADFHDYDVLKHAFRCVKYAPPEIRFAALLHDVGKPFCFLRDGNFYRHAEEGERIAGEILSRLKAPAKLKAETCALVKLHMRDSDGKMKQSKVRRELAEHYPLLEKLFALRQADYSACKDDLSPAPAVEKWRRILKEMRTEGAPLSQKELAVNGKDLLEAGVPPKRVGEALADCMEYCVQDGARNERAGLIARAKKRFTEEV